MTFIVVGSCMRCLTKKRLRDPQAFPLMALDFVMMVTSLVVGILGLASVIGMPLAASWACIGVGGAIPLLCITTEIVSRYEKQ